MGKIQTHLLWRDFFRFPAPKQRLKREGYPSPDQIIQCAKSKIDWPDERWDEIRRAADTAEKPEVRISNNKIVFAHIWQRHRRWCCQELCAN